MSQLMKAAICLDLVIYRYFILVSFYFADNQLRCMCHILSTIIKHIVSPYESTNLSAQTKELCSQCSIAINKLQKLIGRARKKSFAREMLGTCLVSPISTRFASILNMVKSYMLSSTTIGEVFKENDLDLHNKHTKLLEKFQPIYQAYLAVAMPISDFITEFEVMEFNYIFH